MSKSARWITRRRVLDAFLGAVIVASGVVAVMGSSSSATATSPPNTAIVTRGTVQTTESTSGTVVAAATFSLGFSSAGTVTAIDVSVGQQVVQGQVLAAIGATAARSALTVAQDNLAAAQDRLAQDEQAGTTPTQGPTGSSSTKATATTLPNPSTIAADEAVVVADEQVVSAAQQELSGTTLVAPANGTITAINAQVGQAIGSGGSPTAAKSSGGAATASGIASGGAAKSSAAGAPSGGGFMTLTDLSQLDVTCDVAEANIGAILQGQSATVSLPAIPGHELAATVASVAPIGTTSGGVVTFPVTLALQHPNSAVKPGMSATVTIVTASASDVLAVPSSAVHGVGKTGTVTVRSAKGVDSRVSVVIGVVGTSTTAVYGDLTVGETVVLPSVSISAPVTGAITRKAARTLGGGPGGLGGLGGHVGHSGGAGKLGRRG